MPEGSAFAARQAEADGGTDSQSPSPIFVLFGPGGAGKGTIAARMVEEDSRLWLSRSWTTRARRPGEPEDAYVFVDRPEFEARIEAGGFFEWAEFIGNLYGTPIADAGPERDVLLEIDLQGARQVRALRPNAVLVLLLPPSLEVQEARLRARGDDEEHIARRLAEGKEEERSGRALADHVVINHTIEQATADVASILAEHRAGGE
jgi:guanylate kinase